MSQPTSSPVAYDAIIVGAGFSGLYLLHRLRKQGLRVRTIERGAGVGGTWYWNRYPGARCDVESMEYSYKFDDALQQEWQWTERYAAQPEIEKYLNHVADRFDLRKDIQFDTEVNSAQYDEKARVWNIGTKQGHRVTARYFVGATGCLSMPSRPTFPGEENFKGTIHYTSRWPREGVDFTGQRVAVIGTGSSAIQSIPLIAEQAKQLTVFQRTPNFSVPACNRPLTEEEIAKTKMEYPRLREHAVDQVFGFNLYINPRTAAEATPEQREAEFERRWNAFGGLQFLGAYSDLLLNQQANDEIADFIRRKIRTIVKDPAKAEKLLPKDHAVGCKRLCSDTDYYETFNRGNVGLVDIREEPIQGIEAEGLRYGKDKRLEVDAIVFATGFDAMTGALLNMNIQGRGGRALRDAWEHGARTYLGLTTVGFPNLFMVTGPGSPSVLSNMVMSIEDHVDWISDCIAFMEREHVGSIEPTEALQEAWMEEVSAIANATLYAGCNSWYQGSNIPGKPRSFAAYIGFSDYRKKIQKVARDGYATFELGRLSRTAVC
jgi:cyclohexanone monooxygenase